MLPTPFDAFLHLSRQRTDNEAPAFRIRWELRQRRNPAVHVDSPLVKPCGLFYKCPDYETGQPIDDFLRRVR